MDVATLLFCIYWALLSLPNGVQAHNLLSFRLRCGSLGRRPRCCSPAAISPWRLGLYVPKVYNHPLPVCNGYVNCTWINSVL